MIGWILRICAIGMTIGAFFGAFITWQDNRLFDSKGRRAQLEVPDKVMETTRTSKKAGITTGESTSYSADVAFVTEKNERITVKRDIPMEKLDALMAGQPVYVQYLPDEPRRARLEGEKEGVWMLILIGLAALIVTVVFWKKMAD